MTRDEADAARAKATAKLDESKSECERLLVYAERKAEAFRAEVLAPAHAGHVRRVAAAGLLRFPQCLRAIRLVIDAGLPLEADGIIRTIVEVTITACWVGVDEERAQSVWDRSIRDRSEGLKRVEAYSDIGEEIRAFMDELRETSAGTARPNLEQRSDESIDTQAFPARRVAKYLYAFLYDPLSAAAHGDIRFGELLARKLEFHFLGTAMSNGVCAGVFFMMATAAQLGFLEEYARFLDEEKLTGATKGP